MHSNKSREAKRKARTSRVGGVPMRFCRYLVRCPREPGSSPCHLIVVARWAPSYDFSAGLRRLFFASAIGAAGRTDHGRAHFLMPAPSATSRSTVDRPSRFERHHREQCERSTFTMASLV